MVARRREDTEDPIFKEKLYFSGYEAAHGTELWATDGDTTALVADLFPYDREPGGSFPNEFTVAGDKLYFFAHDYDGLLQAGTPHTFTLKGRSLPNGTYFVRITGETFTETRLTTLHK